MAGRASSSITYRWTYDVFLSFRGQDTRLGFTGNLYNALRQRGILAFMDDEELQRGELISPSLVKAIQESRIAIVIFSKNYAFSSFCLDELTMILDCSKENGSLVLPVFYGVDPSDVRHQRGSYGEALARHEERLKNYGEKLYKWRMALNEAANLTGYHFHHGAGYEYEFIGKIIKMVSSKIEHRTLHVADYPVGLESRVLKVMSLLHVGSDDVVHMVGIHGIGGIGKTTIALAVYNYIGDHFEASCFLADVRENSNKHGLVHLQEIVLSEILGDKDINLRSVGQGILTIRQRLRSKKVLLVLDDVDHIQQLKAIVGGPDWFGSGSIVIVTTRNKHLLAIHGIESTYEVEELSEREALDLLCWNAFKTDKVDPSYTRILERTVTYASGLPLALEVIGSNLYGKSIDEWKSALDLYKKIPDINIQEILKVSFDSLEEDEKTIFLDIACFFNGYKLADVEDILSAHHGLSMKFIIVGLIEKSLVKIDDGLVTLHDLIQDMGREIVRQESPKDPGKRSRLWFSEDIARVLENNLGSRTIESLFLDFPKDEGRSNEPRGEEITWDGEALKKMENLKTLIIRNGRFNKGPTHLPHSLRVLKWSGYPSPSLPSDFHPKKLSILELPESCLRTSEQIQGFMCLTVLDFGYCDWITYIPDVSGLPNLEKLSFKHCENLIRIHESVGFLDKLRILDAVRCKKLRTFPPIRMTSLEQLNLSHCSILESFPEILGKMENITELHITGSPIKELPFSIQNLTRLRKLELQLCGMVQLPSSIVLLPELALMCVSQCEGLLLSEVDKYAELESKSSNTECLILSHCNISEDFLPVGLTWFANVKDLNLSGNSITILHPCIKECHSLRKLKLDDCRFLREIRWIPVKLETLSAKGCTSLKCLDLTFLPACDDGECLFLKELIVDDCVYLQEIRGFLPNMDNFSAKNCTSLVSKCTNMLLNQKLVEAGNKMFSLPGTKIPEWFTYRTSGESISFWFCNKFPEISLCLVIGLADEQLTSVKFSPRVFINGNKQFLGNRKVFEFSIATDHIFLFDVQLLKFEDNVDEVLSANEWNHVEVLYADHITNHEVPIKQVAKYSGIHVLKHTTSIVQFSNPLQTKINVPLGPNSMEGPCERLKKDQATVLSSPILSSTQPFPSEAEKSLAPQQIPLVERPQEDFGGEISERLPEDEVHPTTVRNDPPVMERCHGGDDVKMEAVSSCELESEESSSSATSSDSDDPFNLVDEKLCVSRSKEIISSGASSADASLASIKEAINTLELFMVNDLSEVCSDPAMQSGLCQLLDQLSTSNHPRVAVEVKEALAEFKRKACASFQEFQATVESVNKLKNFEKQKAKIQKEVSTGKERRKDLKKSIKKASLAIKAKNSRMEELEVGIATLRKQLATKEMDLKQLVLNVKNQEAELSIYMENCDSLDKQARALFNEVNDLLAANSGVEDEGKVAEAKQNMLQLTWSTDITSHLKEIKNKIFGPYEV